MNMLRWIISPFVFAGRGGRLQFWAAFLAYVIVALGAPLLLFVTYDPGRSNLVQHMSQVVAPQVVLLILALAAGSRRLHDIGRSGWWQAPPVAAYAAFILIAYLRDTGDDNLLAFLPYSGFPLLFLSVFYLRRAEAGVNAFGPALRPTSP